MSEASLEAEVSFETSTLLGAALIYVHRGHFHSGVLYRRGSRVRVLHLAWENALKNESPHDVNPHRVWAAPNVEPERLFSLGAKCERIWRNFNVDKKPIHYAIRFAQSRFTEKGVALGPGSQGLTCATFILAVFNAIGLQLIEEDSWPVRTDDDRQFLNALDASSPDVAQILPRLFAEVEAMARRIRPQEVLGACECEPPARFDNCERKARRIVEMLGEVPANTGLGSSLSGEVSIADSPRPPTDPQILGQKNR